MSRKVRPERKTLVELKEAGWTAGRLSEHFGVSINTVYNWLSTYGIARVARPDVVYVHVRSHKAHVRTDVLLKPQPTTVGTPPTPPSAALRRLAEHDPIMRRVLRQKEGEANRASPQVPVADQEASDDDSS